MSAELQAALLSIDQDSACEIIVLTGLHNITETDADFNDIIESENVGGNNETLSHYFAIGAVKAMRPLVIGFLGDTDQDYHEGLAGACDLLIRANLSSSGALEVQSAVCSNSRGTKKLAKIAGRFAELQPDILALVAGVESANHGASRAWGGKFADEKPDKVFSW